jgi:hypothetical protein
MLALGIGLVWLALAPVAASATTLIPVDFAELTGRAETIFVGTVSDIQVRRAAETIFTHVTFSDLRVVKGSHPDGTVQVRLWGGTVDGATVRVFGMPRFVLGETNLVFLAGNGQSACPIVGWGQGRFKVRWDPVSRQELVFDDRDRPVTEIRGEQIIRARPAGRPRGTPGVPTAGEIVLPDPAEDDRRVSLESFIQAIQVRMSAGAQAPAGTR